MKINSPRTVRSGLMLVLSSILLLVWGCQSSPQGVTPDISVSQNSEPCGKNLQQLGQALEKANVETKLKRQWEIDQKNIEMASPYTDQEVGAKFDLSANDIKQIRDYWHVSGKDIAMMSDKAVEKSLKKITKAKPDHPKEAMLWRLESLVDQAGIIPPDAWMKAYNHIKQMAPAANPALWGRPKGFDMASATAGIDSGSWTWLGPGNVGGRIRSGIIHPTNNNTMWVGSIAGGIWRSNDGGVSWSIIDDFMTDLAVTTMIMDPTNSDIMYAGTGEGFFNADAIRGAGIFKSTDGGATWAQLAATATSDFYYVNRLAINVDASVILAATNNGIFRSIDSGASWGQITATRTLDIDFDPNDNSKAVAGGAASDAYYSIDGGASWTGATGISGSGRVELAYANATANLVYASVNYNSGSFYRSTDGGASYTLLDTGNSTLASQGWYDNIIWVDPIDSNIVIIGGVDLYRYDLNAWTISKISAWQSAPENSAHADHHFIIHHPAFDGNTNKTVFFCNDGGIYKTTDVYNVSETSGWQELNNKLGITQLYGAAGSPTSGVIVGGCQDNGSIQYTGSTESWIEWQGGDGGFCAFDQSDSKYCYGEYVYAQVYRSSKGGAAAGSTWYNEYICGKAVVNNAWTWKAAPYRIDDAMNETAEFISPFILDPNVATQDRLLVGGESLWRTDDAKTANTTTTGPTWTEIKTSIGSNITAICVAPGNSDIIWVGHKNGAVYKTTNGTDASPTWNLMGAGTLPARRCQRITVDANDNDVVYACFGGFSADNLYKTINGGTNWADSTGAGATALPDVPIRSLVIYSGDSNWIYVGTEVGVFASEDAGANWSTTNDGPTNCSVDELFWMGNYLVAATHGRGCFKVGIGGSGPYNVTIGSEFIINATDLTTAGIAQFEKTPKVFITYTSKGKLKKKTVKVLKTTYPATQITCTWTSKIAAGQYTLNVQPKATGVKYAAEEISYGFKIEDPVFDSSTPYVDNGTSLTINGTYFGTKKPKVYFQYIDNSGKLKKLSLKITSYTMNVTTGVSQLEATKHSGMVPGLSGQLVIINLIGSDSVPMDL